jgi:hypothetical protein
VSILEPSDEGGSFCALVRHICWFHPPIFSINRHTRAVHNNDGSLGSDIDIGNFDENDDANDDFELREVNRNADEWLEAMFDSDSDNDMEFEGFQEDWTQNNFGYPP